MSDECERVFSSCKLLLEARRNRLRMDIIEANELLRHWFGPPIKKNFDDPKSVNYMQCQDHGDDDEDRLKTLLQKRDEEIVESEQPQESIQQLTTQELRLLEEQGDDDDFGFDSDIDI